MKIRNQKLLLISIQTLLLLSPQLVFASDGRPPQWYEIATGVLAIPAAIIGLAYSFILIKKARLEAKKTELEILEKEKQLRQAIETHPVEVQNILAPTAKNRVGLYLVLRFVLLYLILHVWGLVEDVYEILFTGMVVRTQSVWNLKDLSAWAVGLLVAIQKLPKFAYWLIFFALAWPLFKDVNSLLGLDLRGLFHLSWKRKSAGTDKNGDSYQCELAG